MYIAHSDAQLQLSSADGCRCTGRCGDDRGSVNVGQCSTFDPQVLPAGAVKRRSAHVKHRVS